MAARPPRTGRQVLTIEHEHRDVLAVKSRTSTRQRGLGLAHEPTRNRRAARRFRSWSTGCRPARRCERVGGWHPATSAPTPPGEHVVAGEMLIGGQRHLVPSRVRAGAGHRHRRPPRVTDPFRCHGAPRPLHIVLALAARLGHFGWTLRPSPPVRRPRSSPAAPPGRAGDIGHRQPDPPADRLSTASACQQGKQWVRSSWRSLFLLRGVLGRSPEDLPSGRPQVSEASNSTTTAQ